MAAPYQATTSLWSMTAPIAAAVTASAARISTWIGGLAGWSRRRSEVTAARVSSSWFSSRSRCAAIRALRACGSLVASTSRTSRTGMPSSRNRRITWAVGTCAVA